MAETSTPEACAPPEWMASSLELCGIHYLPAKLDFANIQLAQVGVPRCGRAAKNSEGQYQI